MGADGTITRDTITLFLAGRPSAQPRARSYVELARGWRERGLSQGGSPGTICYIPRRRQADETGRPQEKELMNLAEEHGLRNNVSTTTTSHMAQVGLESRTTTSIHF